MIWYYDAEKNTVVEAQIAPKPSIPTFKSKETALRWGWTQLKAWRDFYVEQEKELRAELVATLQPEWKEGTERFNDLGLVVTQGYNYKVERPDLLPEELRNVVIRMKPELSITEFKKRTAEEQRQILEVVVAKRNLPQLKVIEEKDV